ncbi:hypothetical protein VKT23_007356 [Stygiomarasmius scandens]|uniref:Uncharacterized protein n=1 Tax=Marasmiellus scandens TaxID=2682957 RepID=A0ABR1JK85_9AGAR
MHKSHDCTLLKVKLEVERTTGGKPMASSKPTRLQKHRKTIHTPVFQAPIVRSSSSKNKSKNKNKNVVPEEHAEAVRVYVEQLSRQHLALAQMFKEIPPSRPGSPASDEDDEAWTNVEFTSSEMKERVEALRARVLEAFDEADGDPADGRWHIMHQMLRLGCTRSRHWLPLPRDQREPREEPVDTGVWADELGTIIRQTWIPEGAKFDKEKASRKEEELQKMAMERSSKNRDEEPAVVREIVEKRAWAEELVEFTRAWIADTTADQSTLIHEIIKKDKLLNDVQVLLQAWVPNVDRLDEDRVRNIIQRQRNIESWGRDEKLKDLAELTERHGKVNWVNDLETFIRGWPGSATLPPKPPPDVSLKFSKQKTLEERVRNWRRDLDPDDMMDVDTPSDPPATQSEEEPPESTSKSKQKSKTTLTKKTSSGHDLMDGNVLGFTASKSSAAKVAASAKGGPQPSRDDVAKEAAPRPKTIHDIPESFFPPPFNSQPAQSTPFQARRRPPSPIPLALSSPFPSKLSDIPVPLDSSAVKSSRVAKITTSDAVAPVPPSSSLEHLGPSSPLKGKEKAKSLSSTSTSRKRARSSESDDVSEERPAKHAKVVDRSNSPVDISMASPAVNRQQPPSSSPLTSLSGSPVRPRPGIFPTAAELNSRIPKTPGGKRVPTLTEILSTSTKGKRKSTFRPKGVQAKKRNESPEKASGSGAVENTNNQVEAKADKRKSKSSKPASRAGSKEPVVYTPAVPHVLSKTTSTEAVSGFHEEGDDSLTRSMQRNHANLLKEVPLHASTSGLQRAQSNKPESQRFQKSQGVKPLSKAATSTSIPAAPKKPESQASVRSQRLAPVTAPATLSDSSGVTTFTKDQEPQSVPSTRLGPQQETLASTAQQHQPEPSYSAEARDDFAAAMNTTPRAADVPSVVVNGVDGIESEDEDEIQDVLNLALPASSSKPVTPKPRSRSKTAPTIKRYLGMDDIDLDVEIASPAKSMSSLADSDDDSDDDEEENEEANNTFRRELENPPDFTIDQDAFAPQGTSTQPRNGFFDQEDDPHALFSRDGRINVGSLDIPSNSQASQMFMLPMDTPPASTKKKLDGKRDARGLKRAGTTDSGHGSTYGLGGFKFGYSSQMDVDSHMQKMSTFMKKDTSLMGDDEDEDDWEYNY